MSHIPNAYVSTGKKSGIGKNNRNNQTSSTTSASLYNPYAAQGSDSAQSQAYAPAISSSAPYNPYAATPSTAVTAGSSSSYAPASSYNPYDSTNQQSTTSGTSIDTGASSYNPYATFASTTPDPTAATAPSTVPDFSQALSVPPPIAQPPVASSQPTIPYSSPQKAPNDNYGKPTTSNAFAVATAVPAGAVSATNSSVYQGGPTGGLVSEGNPTQCHKVDYEIKGHEMQLVEVELDPSETVIAEAGAMMFLDEGIDFKVKLGDGSEPKKGFFKKLLSAGGRLLTGESLFLTHFQNKGQQKARVAFAAPYPGTIIPVNLASTGGKIICQKDAFLCAAFGTKLAIHFNKRIGGGLFGGEGFILQKLKGDGMAFIHAGGTVIRRELRGEKLRLDTGCLVAFTDGINFDIQFVPGLKSILFGGEGLFLATLQGTGTVWLQSLPFSRMADRIIQSAPSVGGRRQGEGSGLTGALGGVLDGDGFGFGGGLGRF